MIIVTMLMLMVMVIVNHHSINDNTYTDKVYHSGNDHYHNDNSNHNKDKFSDDCKDHYDDVENMMKRRYSLLAISIKFATVMIITKTVY